jgi:hypothetical protein
MFEQVYNSAIDAYRQRKQAMKSFGQTVGGIAGTIYGGPMGGAAGAQAGGELTS